MLDGSRCGGCLGLGIVRRVVEFLMYDDGLVYLYDFTFYIPLLTQSVMARSS